MNRNSKCKQRHNESCQFNGRETTYVRRCGNEDNAGKMLHALYDPGSTFDPSKRVNDIPETEVWQFSQKQGHPAPSPRVRGHLALNHRRVQNQRLSWLGNLDFEPRLAESEFAVLPLNYSPNSAGDRVAPARSLRAENAADFAPLQVLVTRSGPPDGASALTPKVGGARSHLVCFVLLEYIQVHDRVEARKNGAGLRGGNNGG